MVHGTRYVSELAYQDLILNELPNNEFLKSLASRDKLVYYPTVTREPFHTQGRVTTAIETGELFEKSVYHVLTSETDRAMLCGSPSIPERCGCPAWINMAWLNHQCMVLWVIM